MNASVLIVDENVNAQIITETLLRLRGLDVRSVTDPGTLGDVMARGDVGVMVVDLDGSAMRGFGVLHQLRRSADARSTPPRLLVVTERREPELERFAHKLGADAVLRKPLDPGKLIHTVEGLVNDGELEAA